MAKKTKNRVRPAFIKVTIGGSFDGKDTDLFINPNQIATIQPDPDSGGSLISVVNSAVSYWKVKESPEKIIDKL